MYRLVRGFPLDLLWICLVFHLGDWHCRQSRPVVVCVLSPLSPSLPLQHNGYKYQYISLHDH